MEASAVLGGAGQDGFTQGRAAAAADAADADATDADTDSTRSFPPSPAPPGTPQNHLSPPPSASAPIRCCHGPLFPPICYPPPSLTPQRKVILVMCFWAVFIAAICSKDQEWYPARLGMETSKGRRLVSFTGSLPAGFSSAVTGFEDSGWQVFL